MENIVLYKELEDIIKRHPKNYGRMLRSKGVHRKRCKNMSSLLNYVMDKTSFLDNSYGFTLATRVYLVLNNIESWNDKRVRCLVCSKPLHRVNVKNVFVGYARKTCCKECERKLAQRHNEDYMKSTYGVKNAFQLKSVKQKLYAKREEMQAHRDATHRKNKTFKTSNKEDEAYKILCKKFGEDDVIRQFKSDVYPFNCDFYIKSLDLYIECNFSWTHGEHWFDSSSKEDLEKLEKWKSKKTKYYDNAIQTWTVRDAMKREYAKKNKLKYVVFWKLDEMTYWQ